MAITLSDSTISAARDYIATEEAFHRADSAEPPRDHPGMRLKDNLEWMTWRREQFSPSLAAWKAAHERLQSTFRRTKKLDTADLDVVSRAIVMLADL